MTSRNDSALQPIFEFLTHLEKNNDRAWFEKNRVSYEKARNLFEAFVDDLIVRYTPFEDLRGVRAKDCVMRIYRDIRFSKDKSPYRTSMSASIGPGGKKSSQFTYYLHLEPQNRSMIAGGLHSPEARQLSKFRDAVDRDASDFKSVLKAKPFQQFYGQVEGEKLKTVPKGYARDHPELELLRLKQVVAVHHLSDEMVLSPSFKAHAVEAFKAIKPFLEYLDSALL